MQIVMEKQADGNAPWPGMTQGRGFGMTQRKELILSPHLVILNLFQDLFE